MEKYRTNSRILAIDRSHSENTRETGLNNNVLIVGVAGCGKTGGYVEPNLLNASGSIVVSDTKGTLFKKYSRIMQKRGFKTLCLDFAFPERSVSYNPLHSIRHITYKTPMKFTVSDESVPFSTLKPIAPEDILETDADGIREKDLLTIAKIFLPDDMDSRELFWVDSARTVFISLMAYVMECLPENEQHLGSVMDLFAVMTDEISSNWNVPGWQGVSFFKELECINPDSFAVKKYHMYKNSFLSEKTWGSIQQFVGTAFNDYDTREVRNMLSKSDFSMEDIGREKTVLFVNTSDSDRSMDRVVNLFYSQLLQGLFNEADSRDDFRLKVPVHIILDDFASNVFIPDFDKIISVIRSREISVSIILQSISQLEGMYTAAKASTIINNCDTMLYLGGQDVSTARFFAEKAGKLPETILKMKNTDAWLFTRGEDAELVRKIPPYSFNLEG